MSITLVTYNIKCPKSIIIVLMNAHSVGATCNSHNIFPYERHPLTYFNNYSSKCEIAKEMRACLYRFVGILSLKVHFQIHIT